MRRRSNTRISLVAPPSPPPLALRLRRPPPAFSVPDSRCTALSQVVSPPAFLSMARVLFFLFQEFIGASRPKKRESVLGRLDCRRVIALEFVVVVVLVIHGGRFEVGVVMIRR